MMWEDWFAAETKKVGEGAWQDYMTGDYTPIYLIGKIGELRTIRQGEEQPEGFELVCAERIPLNLDMPGMVRWVREKAKSFPCLPPEVL